jgi:hypothetical protein
VRVLKSKKAEEITSAIQDMVIQLKQGLGVDLERIHTDCGTELESQKFIRWRREKGYRRTTNTPEDPRANGSAEACVGIIKRDARTLLHSKAAKGLPLKVWPYAVQHVATTRWMKHKGQNRIPLQFGQPVMMKRRKRTNVLDGKDWNAVAIEGRYLGRCPDVAGEGHFVLVKEKDEDEAKVIRTSRVVALNDLEEEEHEQATIALGWKWTTDPDGNPYWIHKETGMKQWESPMLLKDHQQEEEEEKVSRRRLTKKTPEEEWLKMKMVKNGKFMIYLFLN